MSKKHIGTSLWKVESEWWAIKFIRSEHSSSVKKACLLDNPFFPHVHVSKKPDCFELNRQWQLDRQ